MLKTKKQSQVSASGLSYNNLLQDVYNAIKDSDSFKNNFQDFTSNSSERLIAELYAYVATQLANRLDQMGNELFVDTASAAGLSRLLKLVGAKIDFPAAASVDVQVTSSTNTNALTFTTGIDQGNDVQELNFTSSSFMSVSDTKGNTWEFIGRTVGDDGEFVYDYAPKSGTFTFDPPQASFTLYEGKTNYKEYTVLSTDVDIITLNGPVIKDSVRVYYKNKVLSKGATNTYEISEFKKVENFFTTDALTATIGTYTIRNMGNGECEICLKPYSNDSETDVGKDLLIMYRVGGGANGNISIGAINKTERFNTIGSASAITGTGTYTIKNTSAGAGGKDELTTEEIRNTVVQEVRNTKIAVTEEDYEYLLPKYDSEIELIKCYGEKDSETSDLAETYGYYANPIAVWLLILKYNKQIDEAYMNGASGLTDIINDISFNTFDINPRFNEKYQINEASLNILYRAAELNSHFNNGVYQFPIEEESALDILKKGNASITVTNSPYVESSNAARRGVNCFEKYTLTGFKTWEELLGLTSAKIGDTYVITNTDINGGVNFRWKCIKAFEAQIAAADVLTYWEQVFSPYVYENLVQGATNDSQYITRNILGDVYPAYSEIDNAFSGDWSKFPFSEGEGVNFGLSGSDYIDFVINGVTIRIDPGHSKFDSPEKLCEYINAKISSKTNIVWLKKNVPSTLTVKPDSVKLPKTPTESDTSFELTSNGVTTEFAFDLTGKTTYGELFSALETALTETTGYKAVWIQANDCWNLGIICASEFTYQDKASSSENALYINILGNTVDSWPLSSEELVLSADQANDYAGFVLAASNLVSFENGKLNIGFNDKGKCDFAISAREDSKAQKLRLFFGLDQTSSKAFEITNKRILTIIFGENNAYLQITTTSINDKLPDKDLYINVFGGSKDRIKLGEYYKNLDDSSTLNSLLKRDEIRHLYSTSYFSDGTIDKYGSEYQIKLSTQKAEAQTFNQLSDEQAPAQVTTSRTKNTSMPYYAKDVFLYMRVDNNDYDGTKTIVVNETEHPVSADNGYAKFDLNWFASCEVTAFVNSLVEVFDGELLKKDTEDNELTIYTVSSAFYSSIDFGSTQSLILEDLFGISSSAVLSKEGQIKVDQINYQKISLSSTLALGQYMTFIIDDSKGISQGTFTVNTGYSYSDFANIVKKAQNGDFKLDDYVVVDNRRIILKNLRSGLKLTITIKWEKESEYYSWKNMFLENDWIGNFESKTSSVSIENKGAYYIDYVESGEDEGYWLVVQDANAFPRGDIYFHMYEDYSFDHIVEKSDDGKVKKQTDEYTWNNLMSNKKVMLTEHIYKQPRFVPFDLSVTCYLPNVEQYSQTDHKSDIENFLKTKYGVYANNVGEDVSADNITLSLREVFVKIKSVTVNYLGYDLSNSASNKSVLTSKFNQKHILASPEEAITLVSDSSTGIATSQTAAVHGLVVNIKYK